MQLVHYTHNQTMMYTRAAIERVGLDNLYPDGVHYAEDWQFHIRLDAAGVRFVFCDDYVAITRIHTLGATGIHNDQRDPVEIARVAAGTSSRGAQVELFLRAKERAGDAFEHVLESASARAAYEALREQLGALWHQSMQQGNLPAAYQLAWQSHRLNPNEQTRNALVESKDAWLAQLDHDVPILCRDGMAAAALEAIKQAYALQPTPQRAALFMQVRARLGPATSP
jgi:hypothetical protein